MQEIWQFVHRHLSDEVPVALAVVTHHEGRPPGKRGFKMALTTEGHRLGTVGGGQLEQDTLLAMRELLDHPHSNGRLLEIEVPTLPGTDRNLPPAGRQWIGIIPLSVTAIGTVSAIVQALDRKVEGSVTLSATGLAFKMGAVDQAHGPRFQRENGAWFYRERTGFPNRAFLIGGGHINAALSRILTTLNFQILVFDPRMDLDTLRNNRYAHQKIVVPYAQIGDYMREGSKSYVVIATPDVTTDIEAMRQILHRGWKYVGLVGDQAKLSYIADVLSREGYSRRDFKKITCPAGLPIYPHSVSEIAIAIASQMIQMKNQHD